MRKKAMLAGAVFLASGVLTAAAQTTPSGVQPAPPPAGETSDRTPEQKTETPLPQRDKTTPEPAGSTATSPKGTTSDRTPEHHKPGDSGTNTNSPNSQ
jgi:hypothetical protein